MGKFVIDRHSIRISYEGMDSSKKFDYTMDNLFGKTGIETPLAAPAKKNNPIGFELRKETADDIL